MPPKKNATAASSAAPAVTTGAASANVPAISTPSMRKASGGKSAGNVVVQLWDNYLVATPQRTKLIDVFMLFLVVVGGLQFAYCVLAGNFPFNAFLSGFSACVGQFVLTASLRIQTTEANKADFPSVSPERAFTDYVFGSMILHFFCINFIN